MSITQHGVAAYQAAATRRIGPMCHVIRAAAAIWFAWTAIRSISHWVTLGAVKNSWGRYLNVDLSGLPFSHHMVAFAITLANLTIAAFVLVFIWRLFGHYLRGSIFSIESVAQMRALGWTGVTAVAADLIARPLIKSVLTAHLASPPPFAVWAEPNDILHLVMALFIVALAHVFKTGVEIADDHRQFI
ncbi:MAG: DUF2975 domain-containing protein [Hyphomicrobiaceae bacterium]